MYIGRGTKEEQLDWLVWRLEGILARTKILEGYCGVNDKWREDYNYLLGLASKMASLDGSYSFIGPRDDRMDMRDYVQQVERLRDELTSSEWEWDLEGELRKNTPIVPEGGCHVPCPKCGDPLVFFDDYLSETYVGDKWTKSVGSCTNLECCHSLDFEFKLTAKLECRLPKEET